MQPVQTNNLKTTSAYTGPNKTRKYKYNGKWVVDHHYGIDLVGGTAIVATADGKVTTVVNKGENNGTMCKVRIQHKDYQSAYYHLKSGSIVVKKGDYVKRGQYLGEMGNTGHSTGKHLHFQIDKGSNASSIDPTDYAYGRKELVGLPAPTPVSWDPGVYITLQHKYIRLTPEVLTTNKVKYTRLSDEARPKCIADDNGYAKYKIGVEVNIREFATDNKGNIWGKTKNTWLCVNDSTGAQVKKKDEAYTTGVYEILYDKYLRKAPEVGNNKIVWADLMDSWKEVTHADDKGMARFNPHTQREIVEIQTDKEKNIWGKCKTQNTPVWVCLKDNTGPQAKKI